MPTRPLPGAASALAGLLLLWTGTARAQAPPPDTTPRAALVSLEFLALGRDGKPVADLKPEDVALKIGGRVRPVTALHLIDVVPAAGAAPASPLPAPYGSNVRGAETRAFVLAVDDDSFRVGTERALREAAAAFLDGLAATDRVALVTMPYGRTKVELTSDRERIRASLAQVVGQAPSSESADEMACRTRRTLESLAGLLEGFAGSASPVTVAFFSASMVGPNEQVVRADQSIGTCALRPDTWQQVGAAAAAGGTRLYIVEPVGLANQVAGLDHLAGATGGVRLPLGGAEENAFTRILRETSAFYRLTFEPDGSQRTGAAQRVELRVARADATVRVRPNVVIPKGDGRAARTPRDLLRQADVARDLPLRVAGFASREGGQKNLKVVSIAEVTDPGARVAAAAAALFDRDGKMVAQASIDPAQLAAGPIVTAMIAPPGVYRLRVAAVDSAGRGGSADADVDVELRQAGALQLSSLVLGLSRGGFAPRLQFGAEPVALAFVEIYNGKPGQQVSATFELATSLNGAPMVTVPGALAASGDHHSVTAAIPIGALPPGDYVVRATIGAAGDAATRVERTLRKRVN